MVSRNLRRERRLANAARAPQGDERVILRQQLAHIFHEIVSVLVPPRHKPNERRARYFKVS